MPRTQRYEEAGSYYHITTRGNRGEPIFLVPDDFAYALSYLGRAVTRFEWRCYAYCLMPNHYHLVLQLTRESLGQGMRWLNGLYAQTFNYRHKRTGHVFGGRYRTTHIESEDHLAHACRYVECNPVRAGLCDHPREWPWSSYRAAVGETAAPPFLSLDVVESFGGGGAYEEFVAELVASIQMGSDPTGLTLRAAGTRRARR